MKIGKENSWRIFFRFWWNAVAALDIRSLACMRISLGIVLLYDLASRFQCLEAHYTDSGMLPRSFMKKLIWEKWYFCFHAWSGAASWEISLFVLAGIMALALMIGYKTRLVTVISWLLLVSLQNRNQYVLNGGDTLLRMALFWSVFLPLGEVYSLDSFLKKSSSLRVTKYISVASFALIVQVALMYFFSGYSKSEGFLRGSGTLINSFRMPDLVTPLGSSLLSYPILLNILLHVVLFSQCFFSFLFFLPFFQDKIRTLLIAFFLAFHFFCALFFNLGIFSWVCISVLLGLIPVWMWDIGEVKDPVATLKDIFNTNKIFVSAALLFLLFIFNWNLFSSRMTSFPSILKPVAFMLRIDQQWNMFRPESLNQSVAVKLTAHDTFGREFDIGKEYNKTNRWHNYMFYMPYVRDKEFKVNACGFICNDWNTSHPASASIASLDMSMEEIKFKTSGADTVKQVLFSCDCKNK